MGLFIDVKAMAQYLKDYIGITRQIQNVFICVLNIWEEVFVKN